MTARRLLRTITIERKSRSISPAGTVAEVWAPVATVRAQVLQRRFNERLEAFGEAEESTIGFRIHALDEPITTADRVVFEGAALDLKDVTEVRRGRLAMLELICRKVTT